jgi:hypothetical protein
MALSSIDIEQVTTHCDHDEEIRCCVRGAAYSPPSTVVCRKVRPIDWRTLFQDPRLISSPEEKWSDHIATEVYPIQSSAKALEKIETA